MSTGGPERSRLEGALDDMDTRVMIEWNGIIQPYREARAAVQYKPLPCDNFNGAFKKIMDLSELPSELQYLKTAALQDIYEFHSVQTVHATGCQHAKLGTQLAQ